MRAARRLLMSWRWSALQAVTIRGQAVSRLIDPAGLGRFRVLGLAKGRRDAVELMRFRPMHIRSTVEDTSGPREPERKLRFG